MEIVCEREKLSDVLHGVCNVLEEPDIEFRPDGMLIAQMVDFASLVAVMVPKESFSSYSVKGDVPEIYCINLKKLLSHLDVCKESVVAMTVQNDKLMVLMGKKKYTQTIKVADMSKRSKTPKFVATAKVIVAQDELVAALQDVKACMGKVRVAMQIKDRVLHFVPDEEDGYEADIEVMSKSVEGPDLKVKFAMDLLADGFRYFPSDDVMVELGDGMPVRMSSISEFAQFTYMVGPIVEPV